MKTVSRTDIETQNGLLEISRGTYLHGSEVIEGLVVRFRSGRTEYYRPDGDQWLLVRTKYPEEQK